MHTIVEHLFIGDELEQGKLSLDRKKLLSLKDITKPVVIFASEGDNITPPQQALDWIIKEYRSTDEIKRLGKVIVYLLHPHIGHLGIFVGTKIAQKEHKEIIQNIDVVDTLPPGLYEMVIVDKGKKEDIGDYDVRFEERSMKDLTALNEGKEEMKQEEGDFSRVKALSETHDWFYNTFASPWVRMFSTETSAHILRQLHPHRENKYIFSDKVSPCMMIFRMLAPVVKKQRSPVSPDNPFLIFEKSASDSIVTVLDNYQKFRDQLEEILFFSIYGNPLVKVLYSKDSHHKKPGKKRENRASRKKRRPGTA